MPISADLYEPSYWLLGDDQLELSKNPSLKSLFAANFKHSLLFNPSLLISDSMAIDNANFRHLIESDPEFRELINANTFSVAVRDDINGRPRDLVALKEQKIAEGKSRVPELDSSNVGLDYLGRNASIVPYSIDQVSRMFSERSIALFEDNAVQERLPNNVWCDVQQLARKAKENLGPKYGLDYFFFHLRDQLHELRPDINVDAFIEDIKNVANQPYITALPTVLGITAIYANKHAEAFEICGGRSRMVSCGEFDARSIPLLTGLAAFGKGMALLPTERILRLRDTDEARAYFEARNEFNVSVLENSKRAFLSALGEYVRHIEFEIIQHTQVERGGEGALSVEFDVKERRTERWVQRIDSSPDLVTYILVSAAWGASMFGLDLPLPDYLGLLFVKPVIDTVTYARYGTTSKKMARDKENRMRLVAGALERQWNDDHRLDADVTAFSTTTSYIPGEILYTSEKIS